MRGIRATIVVVEKQWVLYNLIACVFVAFVIERAMRMRRIIICGLSRSTIFSTLSHKGTLFEKISWTQKCEF
jgi:hypothetical protein